jgi:signal transduction histidine kinase
MENKNSTNRNDSIRVSWTDIVRFIRQLSHDLRNDLNAAELQAAYIDEVSTDAELKAEIRRLREMLSQMAGHLQKLSARVGKPQPQLIEYPVSDLLEDLQAKIAAEFGENGVAVKWETEPSDAVVKVDPQLLQEGVIELFANAFRHERDPRAPLKATGKIDNGRLVLTLHEPKTQFEAPTENWGRQPLRKASPGHYGLGLNRARVIVEAQGGELRAHHDSAESVLRTTITLPLLAKTSGNVAK